MIDANFDATIQSTHFRFLDCDRLVDGRQVNCAGASGANGNPGTHTTLFNAFGINKEKQKEKKTNKQTWTTWAKPKLVI